jgi:hypothetical protein
LVGEEESGSALSPYGPMRAGLTTSHRTQLLVLSELLNSLEREVENLHSKYCEAYVILIDVMERLARLTSSLSPTDIIKEK